MRKLMLISALLVASASAQAGQSRGLMLAANDTPAVTETTAAPEPPKPQAAAAPEPSGTTTNWPAAPAAHTTAMAADRRAARAGAAAGSSDRPRTRRGRTDRCARRSQAGIPARWRRRRAVDRWRNRSLRLRRAAQARVQTWRTLPGELLPDGSVAAGERPRFSEPPPRRSSLAPAGLGATAIYSFRKRCRFRPWTGLSRSAQSPALQRPRGTNRRSP